MSSKLRFILGIIGNVTSCAVYASPIPTMCIIRRKKSTEMFSVLPYISTLLTAAFGMYYGGMKHDGGMLIFSVNTIGCLFEASYVSIFFLYGSKSIRRKIEKLLAAEVAFVGLVVCTTYFLTRGKTQIVAIGSISSVVGLTMYIAPLSIMRTVIRTKNTEPLPLTLSIFLLVNGFVWSAFAVLTKDIFIGIPSVVGCFFATGQIILYVYCEMSKPHDADSKHQHQLVEMSREAEEGDVNSRRLRLSVNGHPGAVAAAPARSAYRTASGKIVDLLKELPSGIAACRTASGMIFKESPYHYVELSKQHA